MIIGWLDDGNWQRLGKNSLRNFQTFWIREIKKNLETYKSCPKTFLKFNESFSKYFRGTKYLSEIFSMWGTISKV